MSYIHICLSRGNALAENGRLLPLASSTVVASEVIASSGTSQQSAALSVASPYNAFYYVWTIKNGGDTVGASSLPVYVVFGSNPTAVASGANMRALLLVGDELQVHASADVEKVAIINADITT
jgi:hypothetical protein